MSAIVVSEAPEVRRFAIKYHPPTIVIEYRKLHKLYIKKIKLKLHSNVVSFSFSLL